MKNKQTAMTLAVLSNATQLCAAVAQRLNVLGTSKTIQGNELSENTVCQTAQVVFQQKINEKIGAQ